MRKSFPKILIAFFLTVFVLQIICLFFLLAAPVASQAIEFKPQVGIPGAESGFEPGGTYKFDPKDGSTAPIAKYIRAVYNYAIGIIGILAAVVLMVGGVLWIIAGGNATQIGEAKAWIGAALTGLILALTSYLILSTVNPALVNLQTTNVQSVAEFKGGRCTPPESPCINNSTQGECDKIYGFFEQGKTCPVAGCCYFKPAGGGFSSAWTCGNMTENDCDKKVSNYHFYENKNCQTNGTCS